MSNRFLTSFFFGLALLVQGSNIIWAQDSRAQYPRLLSNSYFGIHIGYIDYRFSNSQLQTGLSAETVHIPHLAVRAILFGHEFNKYLSAQINYLRPVEWVNYGNVNGDHASHSVWMNIAGLTVKARLPVTKTLSVYGESGLGLITRKGFDLNASIALKNAEYSTILMGAGLQYHVRPNWNLVAGATLAPANAQAMQPRTSFLSAGFDYTTRPLSPEELERNSNPAFIFPKNIVQLGYTTNALGYGVNDFFSKGAVPIFWAANVRVAHGLSINYQRNVFHTRRLFALDWGGGFASFISAKNGETFFTSSLYPVLRLTPLRLQQVDMYVTYSLAGPTFISRITIDHENTGRRFTFQDFMGGGVFIGRKRSVNVEMRIEHYSNGNLFPRNPGITVPLSLSVGYAF